MNPQQKKENIGRHRRVATYVVMGLACIVYLSASYLLWKQRAPLAETIVQESIPTATTSLGISLPRAIPIRLHIPKIGIDVPFAAPLGVKENGEVEVPKTYDEVGWYQHGPTPGERGPSVIFGHVDSKAGPAVFYSLGQVAPGDEVVVDRIDGTSATFIIHKLERVPQGSFPTESVYGDVDQSELRLITCTGTYDRGVLRYSHNLIVYATLAGNISATTSPVSF